MKTKRPLSAQRAVGIAARRITGEILRSATVYSRIPSQCQVYRTPDLKNLWAIIGSEGGQTGTKSSRLICISKRTGRILYDGPANDEG